MKTAEILRKLESHNESVTVKMQRGTSTKANVENTVHERENRRNI